MNVVVAYLESVAPDVRPGHLAGHLLFEIDDRLAAEADQMVVPLSLRVEPRHRTRVTDPGDQTQLNEGLEDAVHGGPRDGVNPSSDLVVDLVGRGVILSFEDHLEDGPPLRGHREAPLAAEALELLDPVLV